MFVIPYSATLAISAATTLDSARSCKGIVKRDMGNGYCWYHLPTRVVEGEETGISLCFEGSDLFSIRLSLQNHDRYGNSWADFSEEKETRRARDTIEWMKTLGILLGNYEWGTISGGYDPKSATGGVYIHLCQSTGKSQDNTPEP